MDSKLPDPEQLGTCVQLPTITGSGLARNQVVRMVPGLRFLTGLPGSVKTSPWWFAPSSDAASVGSPYVVLAAGAGLLPSATCSVVVVWPSTVGGSLPCVASAVLSAGLGPAGVVGPSSQAAIPAHSAIARINRIVIRSFPFRSGLVAVASIPCRSDHLCRDLVLPPVLVLRDALAALAAHPQRSLLRRTSCALFVRTPPTR